MTDLVITISDGTTTVELPGDLEWTDEYQWSPIAGESAYSLGGRLVVHESAVLTGRPLTLSGDPTWLQRGTIEQLRAMDLPSAVLTVTLADGRQFLCGWRRDDGPPIRAESVAYSAPSADTDWYSVTLQLFIEAEL